LFKEGLETNLKLFRPIRLLEFIGPFDLGPSSKVTLRTYGGGGGGAIFFLAKIRCLNQADELKKIPG
jgi:hypothetical protein